MKKEDDAAWRATRHHGPPEEQRDGVRRCGGEGEPDGHPEPGAPQPEQPPEGERPRGEGEHDTEEADTGAWRGFVSREAQRPGGGRRPPARRRVRRA